jgi:hypothetical protein
LQKKKKFLRALEAAVAEKGPSLASISNGNGRWHEEPSNHKTPAWHTAMPYLRLYCCLHSG